MSTVSDVSRIVHQQAEQAFARLQRSMRGQSNPVNELTANISKTAVTSQFDPSAFKVTLSQAAIDLTKG